MTAPLPDPDTIRRLVAEVIARLQAGVDDNPTVTVADRVITLAVVAGVPSGTRRVRVPAAAVVTPSAREGAAERGLEIVRGTVPAGSPAAARPFIVARADCPDGAAARVAAVHRAVPNASQLPPTGLADVVAALAAHASRDAARGVLLTSRPATAAILANRQAGLRAVTGRDVPALLAAASESCANLLVVDPRHLSAGGLERLCAEFARRELGDVPADLAASSRPCACDGHPH